MSMGCPATAYPRISGTRISAAAVARLVTAGWTRDQIRTLTLVTRIDRSDRGNAARERVLIRASNGVLRAKCTVDRAEPGQ
jgi:hypothetical protein